MVKFLAVTHWKQTYLFCCSFSDRRKILDLHIQKSCLVSTLTIFLIDELTFSNIFFVFVRCTTYGLWRRETDTTFKWRPTVGESSATALLEDICERSIARLWTFYVEFCAGYYEEPHLWAFCCKWALVISSATALHKISREEAPYKERHLWAWWFTSLKSSLISFRKMPFVSVFPPAPLVNILLEGD